MQDMYSVRTEAIRRHYGGKHTGQKQQPHLNFLFVAVPNKENGFSDSTEKQTVNIVIKTILKRFFQYFFKKGRVVKNLVMKVQTWDFSLQLGPFLCSGLDL